MSIYERLKLNTKDPKLFLLRKLLFTFVNKCEFLVFNIYVEYKYLLRRLYFE